MVRRDAILTTRISIFLIFFQQCRFVVLTTVIHSDDVYSVGIYVESDNDALSIAGNPQPRPDIVAADAPVRESPQTFAVCHDGIGVASSNVWRCRDSDVAIQLSELCLCLRREDSISAT